MMKLTILRSGALLLALSLTACLKSHPPVKTERFSLPDVGVPGAGKPARHTLVLSRIALADYLDTDRIVIQMDDISLQPARDHLWVDSLSQELRRGLRVRLAKRLPETAIMDPLPGAVPASAASLQLTIDQFQGHMRGDAVMRGQWQLRIPGRPDIISQSFSFSTPLSENGYPALVRALGHNLDQLADQLAVVLQSTP